MFVGKEQNSSKEGWNEYKRKSIATKSLPNKISM